MIRGVPYDAEVEYLESTGTQWIDTGLLGRDGYDFAYRASFDISSTPKVIAIGGENDSTAKTSFFLGLVRTDRYLAYNYDGLTPIKVQPVQSNKVYDVTGHLYSGSQYMTVDGIRGGNSTAIGSFLSLYTLYLFAINNKGAVSSIGDCKIYNCSIASSGNMLRDFVPVRFTNELGQTEGAMYDRVTKKLFRNQGTGSFVIGPDVAKPVMGLHFMKPRYTAKDYMQDGLIAMWDGIENAGWRQHDPNATVWKDLIGTRDAMVASFAHFTSSALTCHSRDAQQIESMATTGSGTYLPEPTNSQVYTIEICLITDSNYFNLTGQYNCYNIFSPGHSNPKGYTSRWGLWGTSWLGCLWLSGGDNIRFIYTRDSLITNTSPKTFSVAYSANFSGAGRYCSSDNGYYVNGKQNTYNGLGSYSARITSSGISIGGNGTEGGINGEIYNVRIYDKMLTADEIAYKYEIDKVRFNLLEVAS